MSKPGLYTVGSWNKTRSGDPDRLLEVSGSSRSRVPVLFRVTILPVQILLQTYPAKSKVVVLSLRLGQLLTLLTSSTVTL